MAHQEDKGVDIRHAQLEDASQISEIHRSHVDRWYRRLDAEHVDISYENLSLSERWGFGGPWMGVETCAVHLNDLLLQRQFPFVSYDDDRLTGEMELFLGTEGAHYGKNLHIGLLYVLKSRMGRGIGRSLVDKAFRFAGSQDCDTITVASAAANVGFYEKCGFSLEGTLIELDVVTEKFDVDIAPLQPSLNLWTFTRGMPMPVGRYQSSAFHVFEQLDRFAIPEFMNSRRDRAFISIDGHPSMIAFTCYDTAQGQGAIRSGRAEVYAWSGAGAEKTVKAALTLLHKTGVRHATILLAGNDYNRVADRLDATVKGARGLLLRKI